MTLWLPVYITGHALNYHKRIATPDFLSFVFLSHLPERYCIQECLRCTVAP